MTLRIYFHSKSNEYNWLSNFSSHSFRLESAIWPSVEHFYQAQKYPGTEAAHQIRQADTPLKARKMGQNRSLAPRADWESVKESVMRRALEEKFAQNRTIADQLIATGDAELIHESTSDLFWGQNRDNVGDNRLGKLIMEIRTQLQQQQLVQ